MRTCIPLLPAFIGSLLASVAAAEIDLRQSSFAGQELRNENLRQKNLRLKDFSNCDLRGVDFTYAQVDRIKLDGADLRGIKGWRYVEHGLGMSANDANFSGTDLSHSRLVGKSTGAYFERANFTNADLSHATLSGRFHGANFEGADLTGTIMIGALGLETLHDELREGGAILNAADLAMALKSAQVLSLQHLRNANLGNTDLHGIQLQGMDMHSAKLDGANLREANLRGVQLYWGSAEGTHFDRADLSDAHFDYVQAEGAVFESATATNTSFSSANLQGANFRNADLSNANFIHADLTGADLTGAIVDGVKLKATILTDVQGLDPAIEKAWRQTSRRWAYDLEQTTTKLLERSAFPLHLLLTPLLIGFAIFGLRKTTQRGKLIGFMIINALAILPLIAFGLFALSGGSSTAQLGPSAAWKFWFSFWPIAQIGLGLLILAGLITLIVQSVQLAKKKLGDQAKLVIFLAFFSTANAFFAFVAFVKFAPDA